MPCSLCTCRTLTSKLINQKEYLQCANCKAIFLSSKHYLPPDKEKERYDQHNNDVTDPRYQEFVRPVVERILQDQSQNSLGLDYGCGPGPVISSELNKKNYSTRLFDPYYHRDPSALTLQYDYIICCEVMEHFQNPTDEFKKLRKLLKKGGQLYCKTSLWKEGMDFKTWYYKDDPTHVTFYTRKGLEEFYRKTGFSQVEILEDLIVFTN